MHWVMSLRLQTKLLGGLAGVLFVMVVSGGWSVWQRQQQAAALSATIQHPETPVSPAVATRAERAVLDLGQLSRVVAVLTRRGADARRGEAS